MEKYTGTLLIQGNFSGSKSDGYEAYLVTDKLKLYQLYRKGALELNDNFFYPFYKKQVEITGLIEKDCWIKVEDIKQLPEVFDAGGQSLKKDSLESVSVEFRDLKEYFNDLINSEVPILSLVESINKEGDLTRERLYIKARLSSGDYVYAKVNETALTYFFQDRLSMKELFLLRNDEYYLVERTDNHGRLIQEHKWLDENFERETLDILECGSVLYNSIPEGTRLKDPFTEVLKRTKLYWINAHAAINLSNKP